jgi:hypothetical protein
MAAIFASSLKRRPKATEEKIQMLTPRRQELIARFPRERIIIINIEEANLRTVAADFPTSAGKESECVNVQVDNADHEPVTVIEEIDGVRNEVPLTIVGKRKTKS